MMYLTKNFTLEELTKSPTALRLGIDNWPTLAAVTDNLKRLATHILQPIRDHYAVPVRVSSGYRCLPLNRAVLSDDTSQHVLGQAADFEVPGIPNPLLARWIQHNLEFDQLILEFHTPGHPNSGWVHCSHQPDGKNRKEVLTYTVKNHKLKGLME